MNENEISDRIWILIVFSMNETENDCHCNGAVTEIDYDWIALAMASVLLLSRLMVAESCRIYREQLDVLEVLVAVEAAPYTLDEH